MRDVKTGEESEGTLDEKLVCTPEELEPSDRNKLMPVERQVRDAYDLEMTKRSGILFPAIVTFLIFCVPLLWYFLLDSGISCWVG